MKAATKRFGSRAPLLANMVEAAKTPRAFPPPSSKRWVSASRSFQVHWSASRFFRKEFS